MATLVATGVAAAAPPDAVQGQWQRLMYVHVPAAWTAYAAFLAVAACSVAYLRTTRAWWDRCANAAAEIGVVACGLTLVSGSVWGRAVWGVWWTWDPRLVSTAVMGVVYVAYLGLRGLGGDVLRLRRRVAWLGTLAVGMVPLVHFSVVWWSGLHQQATLLAPPTRTPPLDPRMAVALALAILAASTVALWAFTVRVAPRRRPLGQPVAPGALDRVGTTLPPALAPGSAPAVASVPVGSALPPSTETSGEAVVAESHR